MGTTPNRNEQWLLDGICQECRRKEYCSKPCKRNKVRIKREIAASIAEKTKTGLIFDTYMRSAINSLMQM